MEPILAHCTPETAGWRPPADRRLPPRGRPNGEIGAGQRTWIRTASKAGVWLARCIIGTRCEPSPAHEAHCAVPALGRPGTWMVTTSGAAPPLLSSVATKNAGTGSGAGASLVLVSIRQAVWKWPRTMQLVSTELST